MKSKVLCLAISALALLPSCAEKNETSTTTAETASASQPALTPPEAAAAKELIAASPEFSDYHFTFANWSFPIDAGNMHEQTKANLREMAKAGWIEFDGSTVVLKDKASRDRRWLLRANNTVDVVPIAKKELTEVTAIRPANDGNVVADFSWRWIPNEVGASFQSGPVKARLDAPQFATATLQPAEGKWIVYEIVERKAEESEGSPLPR